LRYSHTATNRTGGKTAQNNSRTVALIFERLLSELRVKLVI
jgi:hypothetical protein